MSRHLHSTDTLLSAGTRQLMAEVFAEKVSTGEILWNPETDEMVDPHIVEHDAEWTSEAEAAVRRLLAAVMLERAASATTQVLA